MHDGERKDQDTDQEVEVVILPDGTVLVPVEVPWMAEALGDHAAAGRCREALRTRMVAGERRCG